MYIWVNLLNGKSFVGSSIDLGRRILEYGNPVKLNYELTRGESLIYRAILKYGIESFSFQILEFYTVDSTLTEKANTILLRTLEIQYIHDLNPAYNIIRVVSGKFTRALTEQTRARISASHSTPEARARKSQARTGKVMSAESRMKVSENSTSIKPVLVYDSNGNFLNTYNSIKLAIADNGVNRNAISRAMNFHTPIEGKYYFRAPLGT